MSFFERQAQAKKASARLRILFVIAVILVVIAVNWIVLGTVTTFLAVRHTQELAWPGITSAAQHVGLVFWTSLLTLCVITVSSLKKLSELRTGGKAIAKSVNASSLDPETSDPVRRKFANIVDEMSIAAGVPAPALYVLEHEREINAFSAGYTAADSVVVVTRGTLERLNREELQAIVAHEFGHMLNGDTHLNMRLMGMLHGLFSVSSMAFGLWNRIPRSETDSRNVGFVIVLGAPILLVGAAGYVGALAGRFLQSRISRSRETLADASATQFTRNPGALKNVLVKIMATPKGAKFTATYTDNISHMLFAASTKHFFSTHPPIEERIAALDVKFDKTELREIRERQLEGQEKHDKAAAYEARDLRAKKQAFAESVAPIRESTANADTNASTRVGTMVTPNEQLAEQIQTVVQAGIDHARNTTKDVRPLFVAFMIDLDPEVRSRQLSFLSRQLSGDLIPLIEESLKITDALKPAHRLPTLMKQYAALRQLPNPERLKLLAAINGMLQREGNTDVHVYATRKLAQVMLRDELTPMRQPPILQLNLAREEVKLLLSVLAKYGQHDETLIAASFVAGWQHTFPQVHPFYEEPKNWSVKLDAALTKLDRLAPTDKGKLVNALAATIAHDGQLAISESELLRVVCATLHCPIPPLIASA